MVPKVIDNNIYLLALDYSTRDFSLSRTNFQSSVYLTENINANIELTYF